ncbi:MAG: UbiA family prenyltransferase, partial [Candidatus Odinarchaeia archaeon]
MYTKIKAIIEASRVHNCVMGSLTTTIAILSTNVLIYDAYNIALSTLDLVLMCIFAYLAYFFIAGAGNIINDIFDLEVDKINRPTRPLPRGAITVKEAKVGTFIFWIIGMIFAFLISLPAGLIGAAFSLIGYLYAAKGKILGVLGNFAVAFSFAFGLLYGALITYYSLLGIFSIPLVIWLYFFTAFFVLQGREVIKGMEDIEGDKIREVKTIARVYGLKKASIVASAFNITGMLFFTLAWILGILAIFPIPKIWYTIFLIPGDLA